MRIEYVLIFLLFVAAFFGSRGVKPDEKHIDPEEAARRKRLAKDSEDLGHFQKHFVECYVGILAGAILYQSRASTDGYCAWVNRHLSESCIRFIEEQLADQSEHGATSSSTAEVVLRSEELRKHEADFIRFQQGVHANVEKVRDHIFHMQKLAEQLAEWKVDKSFKLQEDASKLIKRIEEETSERWKATDQMLVDADKDPVGKPDAIVTPKVVEFRNGLVELRSKIRTDLAARASMSS